MVEIKLLGHLTHDVKADNVTTKTNESTTKAIIRLACKIVGYENSTFLDVVAWGKLGEIAASNLSKGSQVYISAIMENNNYESNGVKHYTYSFTADKIEFLSPKKGGNE